MKILLHKYSCARNKKNNEHTYSLPLTFAYIRSCTRLLLFGTFELAISKPGQDRKELYTSKESPITHCLKEVLKLEEFLPWRAPDEF